MLNDILKEITKKGSEYDEILTNILGRKLIKYKTELISEIALNYLKNYKKIEKVIEEGYFKYYFIMTVKNQVHSNTSSFYKNVRLNDNGSSYDSEDIIDEWGMTYKMEMEDKWNHINELKRTTKINYFESEMMRLYFDEGMTYRAIAEEYEINHTLVFKTIKDVIERMKKQLK